MDLVASARRCPSAMRRRLTAALQRLTAAPRWPGAGHTPRRALIMRSLLTRALGGGAALVLLLAVLTIGVLDAGRTHHGATRWAEHSADVLGVSQLSEREVVDLETGVRGYAATGDRLFLAPWSAALQTLPGELIRLRALTADNPRQFQRAAALNRTIDSYVDDFMAPFVVRPQPLRGQALLTFMKRGKVLLDGIRAQYARFDVTERTLQAVRDRRSEQTDRRFVLLSVAAAVVMAAGVAAFLWFTVTLVVLPLRRTIDACVRVADGEQGVRLPTTGLTELGRLGAAFNAMLAQLQTRERERRTAAERVEQMLQLHETVIAATHHAYIAFDTAGTITDWNPAAARTFGHSRANALGRPVHELVIPPRLRATWARELQRYLDAGESTLIGGELTETVAVRAGGGEFPVECTVAVATDRDRPTFHAFVTDISDRVARQQELQLLASVVEQSEDAIFSKSVDGTIISWNRGAERLYGYAAAEIVGRPISLLIPEGRAAEEQELLARALVGEPVSRIETERVRKDGSRVYVSMTISPLRAADGAAVGASIVSRDVSERRRMEDALRASREQALEASRLKSEFVANMSHEIRTPLNGVVSMAELLLQTPLDSDQSEYAQVALTSAEALMRVINDILDFSKIEAGKLEIVAEDFSLRTAVEEVAEIVGIRATERGLTLRTALADDVADVVRGDGNRVRQVLMNLLSNAVKFTSRGEVAVDVSVCHRAGQPPRLRLEVSDTGIGIDAARIGALFEPFVQEDATTTRRYGGTGLGLCISKQLVELMGGDIGCESEQGVGSRFWFELPYEPGTDPRGAAAGGDLTGTRVLIVGDNPDELRELEGRLASWGISPDSSGDAAGALDRLRRAADAGRPYETALIDRDLAGGADGLQLARSITATPGLRSTRLILIVTAAAAHAEVAAAGVDAQLIKPVRQSRLYNQLVCTLRRDPRSGPGPGAGPATPGGRPHRKANAPRVLVAEDNEVNQLAAIRLLQACGLHAEIARTGRDAVTMSGRGGYAAVFMDCQMPELDGYAAARAIRSRERETGARIPIIALTANALDGDRQKCLAAGMDDYLVKPLRLAAIQELVARTPALRPPTEPAADPQSGPPVLDPGPLDELQDPEAAAALAEVFLASAHRRVPELLDAIAAPDLDRVHALAHTLTGSAATVGASRLSEIARTLCELAAAGLDPASTGLDTELPDALAQTATALATRVRRSAA